jgi:hypothetical protein
MMASFAERYAAASTKMETDLAWQVCEPAEDHPVSRRDTICPISGYVIRAA